MNKVLVVMLLTAILVLPACGNKGPLYLPEPENQSQTGNNGKND